MRKPIAVPIRKLSVYLQPFCCSSSLECALQLKIAKIKISSGCFKVIDVDMTKKLVTNACCDRQHAHDDLQPFSRKTSKQRKISDFYRVLLFDALMCRFP